MKALVSLLVIVSFADAATEALFQGDRPSRFKAIPPQIRQSALRKLDVLDAATSLADLNSPPGNRLESLVGNLAGLHSIRINQQWRIVFRWHNAEAHDVAIMDYH